MKEICGNCKYRIYDSELDGWICSNEESEYLTDWIDYDHSCPDFEERE